MICVISWIHHGVDAPVELDLESAPGRGWSHSTVVDEAGRTAYIVGLVQLGVAVPSDAPGPTSSKVRPATPRPGHRPNTARAPGDTTSRAGRTTLLHNPVNETRLPFAGQTLDLSTPVNRRFTLLDKEHP